MQRWISFISFFESVFRPARRPPYRCRASTTPDANVEIYEKGQRIKPVITVARDLNDDVRYLEYPSRSLSIHNMAASPSCVGTYGQGRERKWRDFLNEWTVDLDLDVVKHRMKTSRLV